MCVCVFLACLTCVLSSLWAPPFSPFLLDYDDYHLILYDRNEGVSYIEKDFPLLAKFETCKVERIPGSDGEVEL